MAFTDANITPDFTQSPPQAFNPFTSNNPFCSTYFQGRQIYGGTQNSVAQLNFSRSSDFQNMDYSSPSRANDSITVTLTSQQVNAIKFLVPMISLVVMTGSSAWAVDDGTSLGVITPTSIVANPQVYTGCADVPPLIIEHDILYVQAKGSVVRDLVYNFYVRVYTGADMSVMANHLFFGHQITEWCWAMEPHRVVWCIRDDGLMLSFTYLKDQEIYAWARHDTSGLYKSICTISEGQEDAVYVIVSRLVNGQYLQYIERVQSRNLGGDPSIGIPGDVEKSWFVDAGLQYTQPTFTQSLTPSALTGSITLTAGTAVFTLVTDIGKVIRVNGGIMTVTAVTSTTVVLATTTRNLTSLWPSTSWTMTLPVSAVSGLNHLEGSTVSILADGNVQASQVVTSGAITLQQAASAIVVGLPYQAQIKTLAIDVNTEPTLQGRRKKVPAVTLRVLNTRGLKVGPTFTKLVEIKERNIQPMGQPVQLITSDERVLTASDYDVQGIVCIQQDYPLPATITAIIPELTAGDS